MSQFCQVGSRLLVSIVLLAVLAAGCIGADGNSQGDSDILGWVPEGREVNLLDNDGFVVGYSEAFKNPIWVAYRVFAVSNPVSHPRPSRFSTDGRTSARVSHEDYTNTGYDRGHMAPNAAMDYCYGREGQLDSFLMSNICPQPPTLNRGIWARLEEDVRDWANAYDEVWVFTGPIFDWLQESLPCGVEIPDAFYKIVVDELPEGSLRALAFVVPQDVEAGTSCVDWLESIDYVEQLTGIDFLSGLAGSVENQLESHRASTIWGTAPSTSVSALPSTECCFALGFIDARAECITIVNSSSLPADLQGWTLSDGEGSYTFAASITLAAGAQHTVCMETYNPTRYTRGLYLNNDHDQVYLSNPAGTLCDSRTW